MKKLYKINLLFLLLSLMLPLLASAQFDIPKKPELQTSVYDYGNFLTPQEKEQLEHKLVSYSDSTSTQIVVITVETIKGESIGELTPKWAHEWGIGQADKDNGILLLLAKQERDIWIAPGYGVDNRLTAGVLGEMTREVIIPEFKQGNFYAGLDKGSDAIFQLLNGKYKEERVFDGSPAVEKPAEIDLWKVFLRMLAFAGGLALVLFVLIRILAWIFGISTKSSGGPISYYSPKRFGRQSGSPSSSFSFSKPSSSRSSYTAPRSSYTPTRSSGGSSRSGFRGGFGGGGFSGGGAGGKW